MALHDLRDQLQTSLGAAYTLDRELGGGGMSRVFVAEETAFGRRVVIKLLAPDLAASVNVGRFEREIQVAARLQHPHIIPLLAAGDSSGLPWYSMPFVEGESLRVRLSRSGRLAIGDVVSILRDVARALAYAHERGIVHRDIKPDNVLLSGSAATVADFGIAKALTAARIDAPGETLTQLGASIGTPAYMAPEQAAGDPNVDHRADFYAFGCMAYEMLVGHPPFPDRTPQRLLAAHMVETPTPIASLRPDVPAALAALVMRCLAKDPSERPQLAADIEAGLDATRRGAASTADVRAVLDGSRALRKALLIYVFAFVAVAILARTLMLALGLPDWVFSGALIVMALGLPAVLLTSYASLSWRRTARWGAYALGAFAALVTVTAGLRAAGVGPFRTLFAAGSLKSGDAIVVGDFAVSNSADSSLGRAIADGVKTDLAQFAGVSIVPDAQVTTALLSMDKEHARLIEPVARDVAIRVGARAVLSGALTPVGSGFLIVMRLVTPDSGRELASVRKGADSPSQLIDAVGDLTRELRERMGESLKSVRATPPLADVMTASLPALRKYSDAMVARRRGDFPIFERLMKDAISLDSSFASAYRMLAQEYSNRGINAGETAQLLATGMRYRDRLSERTRLYLISHYYRDGPLNARNPDSAQKAIDSVIEQFPDAVSLVLAGNLAFSAGETARVDSLFRRAAAMDTTYLLPLNILIGRQLERGEIAAAETTFALIERYFKSMDVPPLKVRMQFARGSIESAQNLARQLYDSNAHDPARRELYASMLATLTGLRGALREQHVWRLRSASNAAVRGSATPALAERIDAATGIAVVIGDPARAARMLDSAVTASRVDTLPPLERPNEALVNAYAMAGRPDRARVYLVELSRQWSENDFWYGGYRVRQARARIALSEKRWDDALGDVREGQMGRCPSCAWLIRGMAFDGRGSRDSAIANYERYAGKLWAEALHTPGVIRRLGELFEQQGDRARAIARYRQFVALWKQADPDLQPQVADVARRIARLETMEAKNR